VRIGNCGWDGLTDCCRDEVHLSEIWPSRMGLTFWETFPPFMAHKSSEVTSLVLWTIPFPNVYLAA
jgi:hypothetical protein